MRRIRQIKQLNRADIVKAFSAPDLTRSETLGAVNQYMGDSPVPPAWTYASVRGVFGKRIARQWARHLRHRPVGTYRDAITGRSVRPVVQTAYDFGTTPERISASENGARPPDTKAGAPIRWTNNREPIIFDEFHSR